jgi:oligoendopeptidase F
MTHSTDTLPHWDLDSIFPGPDSESFCRALTDTSRDIEALEAHFDRHAITRQPVAAQVDDAFTSLFETSLSSFMDRIAQLHLLEAYLYGLVSVDSREPRAQARYSEVQQLSMRLSVLGTRLTLWLGGVDVAALTARSELAAAHLQMLRRSQVRAAHLMSPAEENLAAELGLSGSRAWERLHSNFTSQIVVPLELDGTAQRLPMSAIRILAFDPNPRHREAGYRAEVAAWRSASVPLAAALNGVKGEVNALCRRRGWESALEASLFDNALDRPTLDAMLEAARETFPEFRQYMQAKARWLGLTTPLPWWDLYAPVGTEMREWPFPEAQAFILEQFDGFSPRLAGLAKRAFDKRWIDAEPREGKSDGGYCEWIRADESRILVNYEATYDGLSTLAHELGHAYHNLALDGRTPIQRSEPMALAETASIFCETIVRHAAMERATPGERLYLLEASLQGSCALIVDISSRLLFEQSIFEQRRQRELSADEFCERMLDAQSQTYGDGLAPDALHPYMWAVKPHYYSGELSFYNYPYMYGLLFGLGLYALYRDDPARFRIRYDDLLSRTGMADAPALAADFGMDVRSKAFWHSSLEVLLQDVKAFEELVSPAEA